MIKKKTPWEYKEKDDNAPRPRYKVTDDVSYHGGAVKHTVRAVEPRGNTFVYTIENGHKIMEEDLQPYTLQRGWI